MQHQRAADIRVMLETNSHFEQTLEMLCEMLYRSLRRVLFTYWSGLFSKKKVLLALNVCSEPEMIIPNGMQNRPLNFRIVSCY